MDDKKRLEALLNQSRAQAVRRENEEVAKKAADIDVAKCMARADYSTWVKAIEKYIKYKYGTVYTSVESVTAKNEDYEASISMLVRGLLYGSGFVEFKLSGLRRVFEMCSGDVVSAYVDELKKLLGEPFHVEQSYEYGDDAPYRGYIENESGEISHVYGSGGSDRGKRQVRVLWKVAG